MTIYATIKEGRIIVDEDFKKFLPKMTGRVVITTANRGKEAMYAYYHAVVLEVCMAFLRDMGEPADESYADDFLKFQFAKRNEPYRPSMTSKAMKNICVRFGKTKMMNMFSPSTPPPRSLYTSITNPASLPI